MGVRLKKASRVYQKWRKVVFWSRNVSKKTKLHKFQVMVMPVLLYGAETRAGTQQDLRKFMPSKKKKCLRKIVGSPYGTGEEISASLKKQENYQWRSSCVKGSYSGLVTSRDCPTVSHKSRFGDANHVGRCGNIEGPHNAG